MTAVQSERFKRKHRNVVPNRTGRRHPLRNVSAPPVSWGDKGHRYGRPRTICCRVTTGALLNLKRPSLFAEQVSLPRTHVAWQRYGTRGILCHVRASKKGPPSPRWISLVLLSVFPFVVFCPACLPQRRFLAGLSFMTKLIANVKDSKRLERVALLYSTLEGVGAFREQRIADRTSVYRNVPVIYSALT